MLNREKMHRLLELMLDAKKKRIINPDDPRIMLVLSSDESDMKFILPKNKPPLTSPSAIPVAKRYDIDMLIKNELDIDIAIGVMNAIVSQPSKQGERHGRT